MQIILTEDEYNTLKSRAEVSPKEIEAAARKMAARWAEKAGNIFMLQCSGNRLIDLLGELRKIPFE